MRNDVSVPTVQAVRRSKERAPTSEARRAASCTLGEVEATQEPTAKKNKA